MRVEFLETDESGEHVIMVVDGRRTIVSTSKTVKDILSVKVMEIPNSVLMADIPEPTERVSEATIIESGDIVTFQPVDMEAFKIIDKGELRPGAQYRVLDVRIDGFSIIDDSSPVKMRLEVGLQDVTLARKTPKLVIQKKELLEMVVDCPKCTDKQGKPEPVALSCPVDGDMYTGECELCFEKITRERVKPATV